MHELIIVGGGPAGMTAAVYAARKQIDAVLVSKDTGGQVNWTLGVENYMGYQFIEGAELVEKFEDQVRQFPLEMRIGPELTRVAKIEGGFQTEFNDGSTYQGKALIVATGKRPRMLNVEGEEKLKGRGVTYCSICDGPMFSGKRVAVIGGGNSALESTIDMAKIAEHIDLVSVTPLTGDQILIDKATAVENLSIYLEHEVTSIDGDLFVESLTIRDMKTQKEKVLPVKGIFVEIGLLPNSNVFEELLQLNKAGEIEVSCASQTSLPGVFAAGDVTNVPDKQIVIAAGEGAKAALEAHKYLRKL